MESGGTWNVETVSHSTDGIGGKLTRDTWEQPRNQLLRLFHPVSQLCYEGDRRMAYQRGGWRARCRRGNSLSLGILGMPSISDTDYSRGALRFARLEDPSLSITIFSDDSQYMYPQYALHLAQFMTPFHQSTGPYWSITTVDGFDTTTPIPTSTYAGKYTSLALDSQGRPEITYYAEGIQNLKYATWDGEDWEVTKSSLAYHRGGGGIIQFTCDRQGC